MNVYDLLEKVCYTCDDKETYFFENEEDVVNTLGGILICGNINEPASYLVTGEHFNEKCDLVVEVYGDHQYCYKIEE